MILKKNNIEDVILELFGERLDSSILEKQNNGVYEIKIPCEFKYNGSWKINHPCLECGCQCSFGLYYDSSKSPYSEVSYEQTDYLCSKYYNDSFLEEILKLFANINLVKNENGSYLVFREEFEQDFPVTSSIQPISYSCKKCNSQYLSLFRNGYPYSADKGHPFGIIGTIFIDEIIHINLNENKLFSDHIKDFKKI